MPEQVFNELIDLDGIAEIAVFPFTPRNRKKTILGNSETVR